MKVTVTRDDGTQYDITKQVQYAFDVAVNSMDWGSGFLDVDEIEQISALGYACGFEVDMSTYAQLVWQHRRQQDPNIRRYETHSQKVTTEERDQIVAHLITKITKEQS